MYGKQVYGGRGELELSPEEAEAVRLALAPREGAHPSSGRRQAGPRQGGAQPSGGPAGDDQSA